MGWTPAAWTCLALLAAAWGAAAQNAAEDAKRLPEGAGRDTVAKVCLNCHEADSFRKQRLDRDEWEQEVGVMVDNGAKATDAELEAVVNYLVEHFGPKSRIHVNTAPVSELKAVLGLTAAQAVALVDYREAHGDFKSWQDLLKVPKMDAQKIESKKDLMAF